MAAYRSLNPWPRWPIIGWENALNVFALTSTGPGMCNLTCAINFVKFFTTGPAKARTALPIASLKLAKVAADQRFTYPFDRNHSTASANACFGGVWGRPNSRMALAGLNHILSRAMRAPAKGTRGGRPVANAIPSLTYPANMANWWGLGFFGAGARVFSPRTPRFF